MWTLIRSMGSSSPTSPDSAASRRASWPATWKAMSEESTEWDLPSWSVTCRSTTGTPKRVPWATCCCSPFSTEAM